MLRPSQSFFFFVIFVIIVTFVKFAAATKDGHARAQARLAAREIRPASFAILRGA